MGGAQILECNLGVATRIDTQIGPRARGYSDRKGICRTVDRPIPPGVQVDAAAAQLGTIADPHFGRHVLAHDRFRTYRRQPAAATGDGGAEHVRNHPGVQRHDAGHDPAGPVDPHHRIRSLRQACLGPRVHGTESAQPCRDPDRSAAQVGIIGGEQVGVSGGR